MMVYTLSEEIVKRHPYLFFTNDHLDQNGVERSPLLNAFFKHLGIHVWTLTEVDFSKFVISKAVEDALKTYINELFDITKQIHPAMARELLPFVDADLPVDSLLTGYQIAVYDGLIPNFQFGIDDNYDEYGAQEIYPNPDRKDITQSIEDRQAVIEQLQDLYKKTTNLNHGWHGHFIFADSSLRKKPLE